MKKKIHFILPGCGLRGSFQAGFLYQLFTKYIDSFETYRIDGTSAGAINGFVTILEHYELLKNYWLDINNINDLFNNWSNFPLINKFSNLYYGFYNNGVYSNDQLNNRLVKDLLDIKNNTNSSILEKFSCCATNVSKANLEYVSGTNNQIFDYITASSAAWALVNPIKINNNLYSDGCLLETYPIKYVDNSEADLIIIVGFSQEVNNFELPECDNIINFLISLIDIGRFNSINYQQIINYVENNRCIPITNPMNCSFIDFNNEILKEGFFYGVESSNQFFSTYLK